VTTNELQPDVVEVLQTEEPAGVEPVVKVEQQGPVRVQELPRKAASTRTVVAQALPTPFRLLRPNPRRASAIIVADAAILVAFNPASAQDASTMANWPADTPLPITHTADVWVAAETGTASVSVLVEYWATGEGDE
jgi:hypothetical protein